MTVEVEFRRDTTAELSGGQWSCDNPYLEEVLQTLEDTREKEDYDPDPDLSGAEYAIESLQDGKVTRHDPVSAESATRAVW
jgi:hypothetical protein